MKKLCKKYIKKESLKSFRQRKIFKKKNQFSEQKLNYCKFFGLVNDKNRTFCREKNLIEKKDVKKLKFENFFLEKLSKNTHWDGNNRGIEGIFLDFLK